jgi:hypothetical protein
MLFVIKFPSLPGKLARKFYGLFHQTNIAVSAVDLRLCCKGLQEVKNGGPFLLLSFARNVRSSVIPKGERAVLNCISKLLQLPHELLNLYQHSFMMQIGK